MKIDRLLEGGFAAIACAATFLAFAGMAWGADASATVAETRRPEGARIVDSIVPCARGGAIVVGSLADPKSFNPLMASETNTTEITHRIFDNLVELDCANLDYLPGLAESWDVSADELRWTFRLRRGIEWADGAPFSADDVLFTFRAIYDSTTQSPERDGVSLDGVPFRVTKQGDSTIVIETHKPFGPMLHALATGAAIIPEHAWGPALANGEFASSLGIDTPAEHVFGTGPFRLEKREPGRTVLVRNDRFWKFDGAGTRLPYADRIIVVAVGNQETWRLKFDAREIDVCSIKPDEANAAIAESRAKGFTVVDLGPRLGTIHFALNQKPGKNEKGEPYVDPKKLSWFRDLRFRQAVSRAIDRETIVRTAYGGHGVPIYGPISPADKRWYNAAIPTHGYDPEGARELLAAIGMRDTNGDGILEDGGGNRIAFTLETNTGNSVRMQVAQLIVADLAAVGIAVTLSFVDFNTLHENVRHTNRFEACMFSSSSSGDPASAMNYWLASGSSRDFHLRPQGPVTGWERQADSLATASLMTSNFAERKRLFDRVQVLFAENLGFIYVANDNIFAAYWNRFENVRLGRVRGFHEFLWNEDEIGVLRAP
ncbi:MAG: ABC transporter substrate-binding protein [bacterium]